MTDILGHDLWYMKLKWRTIHHKVETNDLANYEMNILLLSQRLISENRCSLRHKEVQQTFILICKLKIDLKS